MLNNVYIVESPAQLMSAIEAKNSNTGKSYLIVNYGNSARVQNRAQIENLVQSSVWDGVFEVVQTGNLYLNQFLIFYFVLKFRIKFNPNQTKVYIGEYRNYFFFILAKVLSNHKECLLDDGTVTIALQKKYFSKNKAFRSYLKNISKKTYYLVLLYSYILCFKFNDTPPNLFSVFSLNQWLVKQQINERFVSTPEEVGKLDGFYFFGAKYSEVGLFSLEVELLLLEFVFNYIKIKHKVSIIYIAHRDDSGVKLKAITNLGVIVEQLPSPCEVYFKLENKAPEFIGGFYTTSLISLPSLYKIDKVISFNLLSYITDEAIKDNVSYIYDYFMSNDIDIVEVNLIDVL